jgi:ABC-2 type transport system permease protein
MRYLRLFATFCKLGFLNETEYRANLFLHLFETVMSFTTGISVLWVVFSQTDMIGGWHWNEILVVLGLWFISSGVVNMIIAPSIRTFIHDIWLGTLDYLLTKPENHQFMISVRKVMVFNLAEISIGVTVLTTALVRLGAGISAEQVAMFVIALLAGAVVLYGFWIILGSLAMWTVKLENLMLVFYAMNEAGRWPAGMYPYWLRYSLTFIVPIALAITVPAQALVGRIAWGTVLFSAFWAIVMFIASRLFFNYAVRRKYMGASA